MASMGSRLGAGLLGMILLLSAGSAFSAGSDDGFKAFWSQFTAAIGKGDEKAVSQMVKYPIYADGPREIADFAMIWKTSFKPSQRTCLAKQKPVSAKDGEGHPTYSAFCGHLIYVFGKGGDTWKLTDFSPDD